jgi:hypothetical protein
VVALSCMKRSSSNIYHWATKGNSKFRRSMCLTAFAVQSAWIYSVFSARDIFKLPKIIPNSWGKKPWIKKKQRQPTHLSQSVLTQVLALSIYSTRCVQKIQWMFKLKKIITVRDTLPLIPLKILPLASNTLIPSFLSLSEAVLEVAVKISQVVFYAYRFLNARISPYNIQSSP